MRATRGTKGRAGLRWGVLLACAAGGIGCGDAPGQAAFGERRTVSRAWTGVMPGASHAQRFPMQGMQAPGRGAAGALGDAEAPAFTLPGGWEELPATATRLVHVRPEGEDESTCYVSYLPGSAGGDLDNVNRWRGQMGLDPIAEAELAALERRAFFSGEAILVELAGSFVDMGAAEARPDWGLLGAIARGGEGTWFVKFTGPRGLLERERAAFLEFLDSLRAGAPAGHAPSDRSAQPAGPVSPGGFGTGESLRWTAPAGWADQGPRPMRAVSFRVGAASECYVSIIGGEGGGLVANLDRWSGQFGGQRLTPEQLDALPRVSVLGRECPLLEVHGTFSDTMNGTVRTEQALLGVACVRPEGSVFVKMTGPADEVAAARADFEAFCASLEEVR